MFQAPFVIKRTSTNHFKLCTVNYYKAIQEGSWKWWWWKGRKAVQSTVRKDNNTWSGLESRNVQIANRFINFLFVFWFQPHMKWYLTDSEYQTFSTVVNKQETEKIFFKGRKDGKTVLQKRLFGSHLVLIWKILQAKVFPLIFLKHHHELVTFIWRNQRDEKERECSPSTWKFQARIKTCVFCITLLFSLLNYIISPQKSKNSLSQTWSNWPLIAITLVSFYHFLQMIIISSFHKSEYIMIINSSLIRKHWFVNPTQSDVITLKSWLQEEKQNKKNESDQRKMKGWDIGSTFVMIMLLPEWVGWKVWKENLNYNQEEKRWNITEAAADCLIQYQN